MFIFFMNFILMKIMKKVIFRRMVEKMNFRRIIKLKRLKIWLRNVFVKFDFGILGGILCLSLDFFVLFIYFLVWKMLFIW